MCWRTFSEWHSQLNSYKINIPFQKNRCCFLTFSVSASSNNAKKFSNWQPVKSWAEARKKAIPLSLAKTHYLKEISQLPLQSNCICTSSCAFRWPCFGAFLATNVVLRSRESRWRWPHRLLYPGLIQLACRENKSKSKRCVVPPPTYARMLLSSSRI